MKWNPEPDPEAMEAMEAVARACWDKIGEDVKPLSDEPAVRSQIALSALALALANELVCSATSREHLASLLDWACRTLAATVFEGWRLNEVKDHGPAN
jgi:hypothetical protein